jgi:D-ribose pyranase
MKKHGILNARLAHVIAAQGHSDRLVICDCGLPIPRAADVIDLALTQNIPRFLETLEAILEESEIECAFVAEEMARVSRPLYDRTVAALGSIPVSAVPHETFKNMTANGATTTFVRTGEATPYANIILVSGVSFD